MMNKFFSVFIILLVPGFFSVAQEIEFPLSNNPVIKEYLRKSPVGDQSGLKRTQSALSLPFQDDFSGQGIYPNTQLWMDSDVFINRTYCDTPVTIGVATFDGINRFGEPHDSNSTSATPVICDYLTSRPIDLSVVSASDSVYFSFYFQPQGLGDEPEDGDSLCLQFYSFNGVDSSWVNVWRENGRPDSAFAAVRIKLTNPDYFWERFKFRFYNYGTPNGNRDHWNIDYVRLKANETATQALQEISLLFPVQSYLKDFTAMPYSHYKNEVALGNNAVKANISDLVRLYTFTGSTSLALNDTIRTRAGAVIFGGQSTSDLSPVQNSIDSFGINLPANVFDVTSGDMTDFTIKHSFSGLAAGDSSNDASYFTQHFYNYYAYDDGSAESATGVHVNYAKYAYQFDVKMADSLLGIQIFFNHWGRNVGQDLFSICMWDNVNVSANTANLVHQTIDQKPQYNDSINGFVDYYFDSAMWVSAGTHYFGIIQSSINEIGIGVDHNTDSHTKMFLEFNNQWVQSSIRGSWMMRPIFGGKLTIDVDEIAKSDSQFKLYPNPVKGKVAISSSQYAINSISIYSALGQNVFSTSFPNPVPGQITELDVTFLPDGVYFVRIQDEKKSYTEGKRLVVLH